MTDETCSKPTPFLFLYILYVLTLTLHPFAFSGSSWIRVAEFLREFLIISPLAFKAAATRDFVQNVLFFIPFGALLYCCLKSSQKSGILTLISVFVAGCVLSLSIEVSQLFLGRHSAVSDVIANAFGSAFGALIFFNVGARTALGRLSDKLKASKVFLCFILMYAAAPLVFSVVQSPWPNFRMWDSSFGFQLANEATLDRPWLGRIHLVAVYKRALSVAEIGTHFRLRFSGKAMERRARNGLVALYTFAEGGGEIVHDVSGVGDPLNLSIAPATHVEWLSDSNGIEIVQPAIIKSQTPAKKIVDEFRNVDELSVEAWFAPNNLSQRGPARLVSFSGNLGRHNFTLGQEGSEVIFRLRTLISSMVGGAELRTEEGELRSELFHIVASYSRGVEKLYVNGKEHPNKLDVTNDVIIGFGARKNVLPQIGYGFFYFFPVSLFMAVFLSTKNRAFIGTFLTAVAVGTGLMAVTEVSQSLLFHRAIDFSLIGYGLIIAVLGSLAGAGFSTRQLHAASETVCLSAR